MTRSCPDCHVDLSPISLVVKTGDGGDGWLEYRDPDAKGGFLRQPPTLGQVEAGVCPRCARVLMHAVPRTEG